MKQVEEFDKLKELATKIRFVWEIYEEHYIDAQFHSDTYKGFDIKGLIIYIWWERTHNALMEDDDEWKELMNISVEHIALDMDEEDLVKYFAQNIEKKNILREISEYNKQMDKIKKDIKAENMKIAEMKSPDYLDEKIESSERTIRHWTESLERTKKQKEKKQQLLKGD